MRGHALALGLSLVAVTTARAQEASDEGTDAPADAAAPASGEDAAPDDPFPGDRPAHPEAAPAQVRSDVEEVTVYGLRQMLQAREQVISSAEEMGYTREVRGDGVTMLRHEDPWRGQIWLYDDGRVDLRRNPVRFETPFNPDKPASWLACVLVPLCVRPGGQLVSRRRYLTYQREAMAGIEDDVTVWHEKISDYGTDAKVDGLPDRLTALWEEGIPLEMGPHLDTVAARKAALFAYWDTRVENDWGFRVRGAVEAFLRGVVQQSDTPITEAELAAFNRRRQSSHPLSLVRRVDADDALLGP
ncbi:MAG: hypothetical protein H6733_15225 [Alphaproteobacteria bacterium]|nr:hypothetical protein [Alphaproteobacteria bacterium]